MTDGSFYPVAYYLFLFVIVLFYCIPLSYIKNLSSYPKINVVFGIPIIFLFLILYIGLRNPYGLEKYYGDTFTYTSFYENLTKSEIGFMLLMRLCKDIFGLSVTGFYLVCSSIYVGFHYFALKNWFKSEVFFSFIVLITTMFFFSFGVNGLRTGLGFALFFYALSLQNIFAKTLFMVIAASMHSSLLLPFGGYLISLSKFGTIKTYIKFWCISIIVSLLAGKQIMAFAANNLSYLLSNDNRADSYLTNVESTSSFRIDFVIYSVIPIWIGYYYIYKKHFYDKFYNQILKIYLIGNSLWILIIYANYTNRFATLSWFLIPLILIYPILKDKGLVKRQPQFLLKIIFSQFLLTIIMFLRDYMKLTN